MLRDCHDVLRDHMCWGCAGQVAETGHVLPEPVNRQATGNCEVFARWVRPARLLVYHLQRYDRSASWEDVETGWPSDL
jgi:hypothetical protein